MPTMRAKLKVQEVTDNGYSDKVRFSAVYGGSAENNSYSKATPTADLTMQIDNPALKGVLKPGEEFYVDFTKVE